MLMSLQMSSVNDGILGPFTRYPKQSNAETSPWLLSGTADNYPMWQALSPQFLTKEPSRPPRLAIGFS